MTCSVQAYGWAGAALVSAESVSQMSSSKRSYRVDAHCPHLMPTGPHPSSVRTRRTSHRERSGVRSSGMVQRIGPIRQKSSKHRRSSRASRRSRAAGPSASRRIAVTDSESRRRSRRVP